MGTERILELRVADEEDDDLDLAPADAGAAFRAEMAATNFLMGYWPAVVGAIVVVLVGALLWGVWGNHVQRTQRIAASQIADVERDLPAPFPALIDAQRRGAGQQSPEALIEAAKRLEAVSSATSRTAAVEASLKAAELYRMAADLEGRRGALTAASDHADGLLSYAAESALAALDLDAGSEEAVTRYKSLLAAHDGFLAQQASIDLGLALEHLGRNDEATTVFRDFLTQWPDAPRAAEVREHQARLEGAG